MRLIDADKLDWWYKGRPIRRVIDEAPTIDAVEVVRCKDCRWYRQYGSICVNKKRGLSWYGCRVSAQDFCSLGESS